MVSRRQLLALGVAERTIETAVARGRSHRVHRGVYSRVPARARPPLAAAWAAVLACPPGAVLSHGTAATLHGLIAQAGDEIHLTVTGASGSRRARLVVHRTQGCIATTSIACTACR